MTACTLCKADEVEPDDVDRRLLEDYWPEGGRPDHLGLKRELESEFDLSLTVTELKRHLDDHIVYRWVGPDRGSA